MRRAKLAPGSVPTGSLPYTTCHAIPRCFVCDEPIKSHRLSTSLLSGRTQYTHSPLPTKIGGYIGDEFVVVVTPQDALCKHCMALINTMDRLELELRQHRYTLTQHLKTKYKLEGHISKPVAKYEVVKEEEDLEEPEVIEVSDEEWTPNKKQRTDSVKRHRCTICNASYTNLSVFMAHLSHHKQVDKVKTATVSSLPSVNDCNNEISGQTIKFKCGCCAESFATKESLALHMQLHTVSQSKSKLNYVLPTTMSKSSNESAVSLLHLKSEPIVQAAALFEDLEQLSHQDNPVSVGVCTEEQKGRVCLLALLNNGVCSDVTHCSPVEGVGENSSNIAMANCVPKIKDFSDEQTISITVSIPNVLNGSQLAEQQLSYSTLSSHGKTNLYPLTLANPSVPLPLSASDTSSQGEPHQESDLKLGSHDFSIDERVCVQRTCLDMPDLCDNTFQDVSKLPSQCAQNMEEPVTKLSDEETTSVWNSNKSSAGNVMDVSLVTTNISSMDMPSLLDENFLQSDGQSKETSVQIINQCHLSVDDANSSDKSGITNKRSLSLKKNKGLQEASTSISEKDTSDSVGNIAIVSVTSVQVNGNCFNAENIANDWFFSTSSKELTSVLNEKNVDDKELSLQSAWLQDNAKETND